ncbi:MAG: T9SS type A sorting domain-containing protein, partial [Bacteroidota bacterium]
IAGLNVSANTALTELRCGYNQLTSLNVSANTSLTFLDCSINSLTSLDVTANTTLTILACHTNQLTSLNVSANTSLTYLHCTNNQLTSLNVVANTALTTLRCFNNQLTSLNIQNGNNANLTLEAHNNPSLTCIQVDNVANANSYNGVTFFKDATASYSTNCGVTSLPDIDNLASVQIFPNPANNHLTIALGSNNKKFDVTIWDITGKVLYKTSAISTQKIEVNTEYFAEGIYVVQIQAADFTETKKLIVEK